MLSDANQILQEESKKVASLLKIAQEHAKDMESNNRNL
jgi:hypothetical protein